MPGMSSWEEDQLFSENGWYKNLVKRQYESPSGHVIPFDTVMLWTDSPAGEATLRHLVRQYGQEKDD